MDSEVTRTINDAYREEHLKSQFESLSMTLYRYSQLFFELKNVPSLLSEFKEKMAPFFESREKLLSGTYLEEEGVVYSDMLDNYWDFIGGFEEFGGSNAALEKLVGLRYLENILYNTAVILESHNINPKREEDVSKVLDLVVKHIFPDHKIPTQSFVQKAKCYVPDILVPSLFTAIEYKKGTTEKSLEKSLGQILEDVMGYDKNPSYHNFYAVFYFKPGKISSKRFEELWDEKEFPKNWKGIYVEG